MQNGEGGGRGDREATFSDSREVRAGFGNVCSWMVELCLEMMVLTKRAEKAPPEFFILGDKATKQKTSFLQSSPSVSVFSCFLKLKGFDSAVYL